ncbi:phenylacetate-CoA oxygenase subunit PaaC [Pseudoclavibacter chungangensis]|uniref:Phenylacetate-CoA oxygenase subunit PaaC n=1 Tax=Pseudoclavibacter chungangensis TaxID=587635 RepID=A0A7J5BZT0_9MICO|nr:1,2-phenylacetyl-CoA epoxidase subunit PaaC [Pseudoclavibacter chungangensis]KAB1660152.1 phenylacetate-CoA oxygenase subunit PaaC [Pseudoclavibacter chungangensis]NYJ66738.1 ring-1,2-phenylacetyl-CoA epoxidase subunit PaaC [Pseudoclavibacter chungangensis]
MSVQGFDSATRISAGSALIAEEIAARGDTVPRPSEDVGAYALRLGDDSLVLAQRLAWWISRGPEIEEDIALGNIALDTLGHARVLLTYAGSAWGRSEDELAYFRDEDEFRCVHLVQLENGDFGRTIARQLVWSAYAFELYVRLCDSADETLAAIAAKAVKEVDYHLDHATQWTLRLGIGTEESNRRMQAGLEDVWPYVDELFEDEELHDRLDGIAVRPSTLRAPAMERVTSVIGEAGLEVPSVAQARTGGRRGEHREQLGYLLAEMQVLARKHPGASW